MPLQKPPSIELGRHLLAAGHEELRWHVRMGDEMERMLTTAEVVDAYNECLIDPETYVWTDGMHAWQQLQLVDELVDALHAEADRAAEAPPKRNEASAMFSLASLVGDRRPIESVAARDDDSGLIDLAALSAPVSQAQPQVMPFDGGLFPVPSTPKPEAIKKPAADHRGVILGLMVAVALLSALLVFQIVRSGESTATQPEETATTSTTAPPAAPPEIAPRIEPSSPAAESAPEVAGSAPPVVRRPPVPPRGSASAVLPPPPPPPKDSCRCKPEDLDCYMRCAVKK